MVLQVDHLEVALPQGIQLHRHLSMSNCFEQRLTITAVHQGQNLSGEAVRRFSQFREAARSDDPAAGDLIPTGTIRCRQRRMLMVGTQLRQGVPHDKRESGQHLFGFRFAGQRPRLLYGPHHLCMELIGPDVVQAARRVVEVDEARHIRPFEQRTYGEAYLEASNLFSLPRNLCLQVATGAPEAPELL